jgi:RNA polymerase sigma-70 factor (ECF subfamily)
VDVYEVGDERLWAQTLGGDGQAFAALFDRHADRLYRHVTPLVESRQDAEDIVAATFLELWRRRNDVRLVNNSILPWTLVTATNVARNLTRGTRRYRRLLTRLPRSEASPDTATLVTESVGAMDDRLRRAIGRLAEPDRRLLELVIFRDYPIADAAAELGLTISAAKSRLHRTRGRLRQELGEHRDLAGLKEAGGPR